MKRYDVMIIGGGPGGYVAAIRARQRGLETLLIEKEDLGGVCLNWGCIPTKALLRAAEVARVIHEAPTFGLSAGPLQVDWSKVIGRSRAVADQLRRGVEFLMKKNGVQVMKGTARLTSPTAVRVLQGDGVEVDISAGTILLATGAHARLLEGLPDSPHIWTAKEAMVPDACPRSLLIVGSGAIGLEFASFYRDFGVDVTVLEAHSRILPVADAEIAAEARRLFEKRGIKILTNTHVSTVKTTKTGVSVAVSEGKEMQTLTADKLLLAIGIEGNTVGLGLETTAVQVERGHVVVDGYGQTAEPSIYAIGDVARAPGLAHKASHEGVIAIDHLLDGPLAVHPLDVDAVPGCVYSAPQIAQIGLTEEQAARLGPVKVGRFPYGANGKALALGESEGLVKVIFSEATGALLGAHIVGAEATEIIHSYVVARQLETTEAELMETVFAHPTLSEMIHEAVLNAGGRGLHL